MTKAILPKRESFLPASGDADGPALLHEVGAKHGRGVEKAPPSPAELRLVIEFDEEHKAYIYKSVNRITGEIVSQLPHEGVSRLSSSATYVPGRLVSGKH